MKKWIVAVLVGGVVLGSATMAFAAEETPDQAIEQGGRRPGIQRTKGDRGQMAQRLSELFEDYLPEEEDAFEALKANAKGLREGNKEFKDGQKELHGEEFEAMREEQKALAEEWKAKVEAGQATKEEAREALRGERKGNLDEIVGIDDATRAELDEIQEELKALREDGREIGQELKAAVEAEDEAAIQDALRAILEKMEASQVLRTQRQEILQSI
jgi:NADH dehydrogenase/NADH:ubiquinone oxidoreductase subunit G